MASAASASLKEEKGDGVRRKAKRNEALQRAKQGDATCAIAHKTASEKGMPLGHLFLSRLNIAALQQDLRALVKYVVT